MREAFTNLRLRWRALWKRRQLESDLEDELAFHLAMREEKNRRAGVTESARRSFGNPECSSANARPKRLRSKSAPPILLRKRSKWKSKVAICLRGYRKPLLS